MLTSFAPAILLGLLAAGLGVAVLALSSVLGPRRPTPAKQATYESGLTPIGPGRRRVPVRFYLVATLFILFDIEVIYLFPWAVSLRSLSRPAPDGLGASVLASMALFVGVLLVGYVHVWRKGAFRWD